MFCSRIRFFFSFFLFFTFCLGFAQEKRTAIEEMRRLHEEAEFSMSQGDYASAREDYLSLLRLGIREAVSKDAYVNIVLHLASAEVYLKDYSSAEDHLKKLLETSPSEQSLIRIESLRSQLYRQQDRMGESYRILKDLESLVPLSRWPPEERSFLLGLEYSLNRLYTDNLRNAERLMDASLYEESIPLYKEVLQAAIDGFYPLVLDLHSGSAGEKVVQIQYRLSEAYFHQRNYGEALLVLEKLRADLSKDRERASLIEEEKNALYLLGRVYQEMGKTEHAILAYTDYIRSGEKKFLSHYEEAQWQLGLLCFLRGDYEKAEEYFKTLTNNGDNIRIYYLSRIYLAKIFLHKKEHPSVEQLLFPLLGIFIQDESLRYEVSFLRAESFFQRQMYHKAIELFEQAIPNRNKELAEWYPDALYNLAWSCLKVMEELKERKEERLVYFEKSEKAFQELIRFNQEDRAYIGLSRLYILRNRFIDESMDSLKEVEKLLEGKASFSSIDFQSEAFFLLAEATESYSKKREIYTSLTEDIYRATRFYALAWYSRGISTFQHAKKMKTDLERKQVEGLLNESIMDFEKAFELFLDDDKKLAGKALEYAARVYFYKGDKESRLKSYALFHKLFKEHSEIFSLMENRDELLYLQSLVASRLLYEDKLEEFLSVSQETLVELIDHFPEGAYVDSALHLLGTIYFRQGSYDKAERAFTRLSVSYPKSAYAGESWFWVSECMDRQRKNQEIIREYRKKVFEDYPECVYAAEAYFKYYTFSDYTQGSMEPLAHLQNMELLYSQSPFLIVSHYLLGMNHKQDRKMQDGTIWKKSDPAAAIHSFEEAQKVFDFSYAKGLIPEGDLEYFITVRYRALLERALIKLQMAEGMEGAKKQVYLEWAADAFEDILKDFYDSEHPLSRILTRGQPYPRIFEESEYGLAQVYLKVREVVKAEEILSSMLEKYAQANVRKGYYLSRVWYEQGRISMLRGEYELSMKFFNRAEDAAKGGMLHTEQRLDLWIQKSHCYRELKEYDAAMLMLSKAINEDVISPLRLKAMYLRAEIYEMEGRNELAVKQLEATAKKGGLWANKAKEKLERDYGFN